MTLVIKYYYYCYACVTVMHRADKPCRCKSVVLLVNSNFVHVYSVVVANCMSRNTLQVLVDTLSELSECTGFQSITC